MDVGSFSAVFSVDETHDIEFLKKELKALFVTTPNKDIYIINIVSDNAKQARPIVTIIPKALSGKEIENFTARSSYELYHLLKRLMGDALIEEEFNYFTEENYSSNYLIDLDCKIDFNFNFLNLNKNKTFYEKYKQYKDIRDYEAGLYGDALCDVRFLWRGGGSRGGFF